MSLIDDDKSRAIVAEKPDDLTDPDGMLIIWGGADISPSIYHEPNVASGAPDDKPSFRDQQEIDLINKAFAIGMPVLGVCRGAQLCCALAGGKLVQDVTGHARGDHAIITDKGVVMNTSSVHHQMMFPFDVKHELIAWSKRHLSQRYIGISSEDMAKLHAEPEIVYFPEKKFLAVQGHPEFMDVNCTFNVYVRKLVMEYLDAKARA